MSDHLSQSLSQGLDVLALPMSSSQQSQLLAYLSLLHKWNAAYNLTAIRDVSEMLVKHVFDALAIQSHLPKGGHWIDIGSGGGIPGLVLAIVDTSRRWALLDSNGKKTRFLTQAVMELGLTTQVSVVNARAENHQGQYQGIISRAVTDTQAFIGVTHHLRAPDGGWWLMKGQFPQEELAMVSTDIQVSSQAIMVPMLDAERWLIHCLPVTQEH